MAVVTPTDRYKSIRKRCVIDVLGGDSVLSLAFVAFSDYKGVFDEGLNQISSFL